MLMETMVEDGTNCPRNNFLILSTKHFAAERQPTESKLRGKPMKGNT